MAITNQRTTRIFISELMFINEDKSTIVWLVFLGCVPALYWWRDTPKLIISLSVFICCYLISYSWIKKSNDAEQKL